MVRPLPLLPLRPPMEADEGERLLLARGAAVGASSDDGATALMMASESGYVAIVRELLTGGADANARANDGVSALHLASAFGGAEVVRELLARGAPLNAQANNGGTPLICACDNGHLAAATLLLDAGADFALLTNTGRSALWWAERRVRADDEEPAEGAKPPTAALRAEHKAVVALLKARGA